MISQVFKGLKAEFIILSKYVVVRYSLLIALIIYSYNIYIASAMTYNVQSPGYFTSQMLIVTLILNVFFVMIVGATSGGSEFLWNTWATRLSCSSRKSVLLSKLLCILVSSLLLSIIGIIFGLVYDILSNGIVGFPIHILIIQFITTVIVLLFWGIIALFLSILTRSMLFSSSFCIGYFFAEQYLAQVFPENINYYMPIWNIKSLLYAMFDQNGAFGFVQSSYKQPPEALTIFAIYTIIILLSLILTFKQKQFSA